MVKFLKELFVVIVQKRVLKTKIPQNALKPKSIVLNCNESRLVYKIFRSEENSLLVWSWRGPFGVLVLKRTICYVGPAIVVRVCQPWFIGIKLNAQWDVLKKLKCSIYHGFHFSLLQPLTTDFWKRVSDWYRFWHFLLEPDYTCEPVEPLPQNALK